MFACVCVCARTRVHVYLLSLCVLDLSFTLLDFGFVVLCTRCGFLFAFFLANTHRGCYAWLCAGSKTPKKKSSRVPALPTHSAEDKAKAMNVFVDVLLSLLASSARLMRDAVKAAFRCYASECTTEAVEVNKHLA